MACFSPDQETPREKSLRDAKRLSIHTTLGVKCGGYKSSLEKEIEGHRAYLKGSKTMSSQQRNFTTEEDCEAMIVSLQENLDRIRIIQEKAAEVPQSGLAVAPRVRYYQEMPPSAITEYWESKWNVDVAASFYKWAAGVVDVTENAFADDIGDIMTTTFINSAHATWRYVLSPRYENEVLRYYNPYSMIKSSYTNLLISVKSTKPFPTHKFTFTESPESVKQEYRNAANEFQNKGGIELVRVPLAGAKKQGKKRPPPAGELLPVGKRLRRA